MTQQTELLPCAHCGSSAIAYSHWVDQRGLTNVMIRCEKCFIQTSGGKTHGAESIEYLRNLQREEWNTRALQSKPDEFDYMRVREWALNDTRRANLAFTEGTNRNVAYLIEELRLDLNKAVVNKPDVVDVEALRASPDLVEVHALS